MKERRFAAWLSFGVGLVMLVLKMGAYLITDSHAILSDAFESVVHIAATGFVAFAIYYSEQPADEDHPYGHGKVENFSVGFEGGLIFLAGLSIIWETSRGLWEHHQPKELETGMLMIGASIIINIVLGSYLIWTGRRHNSRILIADGKHILSDVVTSVGVLVGVFLVQWTELPIIDSLVAFAVALHLIFVGRNLLKESIANLMDQVDPSALKTIVDTLNEMRDPDWKDVHLLRAHRNGHLHHVDFHMMVPGDWTVDYAHHAMDRIEKTILQRLGTGGSVMIHLDSEPDPELKKMIEEGTFSFESPFTLESATRFAPDPSQEPFRNPEHSGELPHMGNS
jgi:cation diffusion facilitator family transporter